MVHPLHPLCLSPAGIFILPSILTGHAFAGLCACSSLRLNNHSRLHHRGSGWPPCLKLQCNHIPNVPYLFTALFSFLHVSISNIECAYLSGLLTVSSSQYSQSWNINSVRARNFFWFLLLTANVSSAPQGLAHSRCSITISWLNE